MKHETNCRELLSSLSDYADGTLQDDMCRELERHIAGCEDCRVVVDTLKKTIYLYHATTEEAEVPADVRERLYKRLDLEDLARKE
jgi:anti-sigma factor (TIGR02949 family)